MKRDIERVEWIDITSKNKAHPEKEGTELGNFAVYGVVYKIGNNILRVVHNIGLGQEELGASCFFDIPVGCIIRRKKLGKEEI